MHTLFKFEIQAIYSSLHCLHSDCAYSDRAPPQTLLYRAASTAPGSAQTRLYRAASTAPGSASTAPGSLDSARDRAREERVLSIMCS